MHGGTVEVWTKKPMVVLYRVKSILTTNGTDIALIQIQTLPPSMQHKWEEIIDIACKTTN